MRNFCAYNCYYDGTSLLSAFFSCYFLWTCFFWPAEAYGLEGLTVLGCGSYPEDLTPWDELGRLRAGADPFSAMLFITSALLWLT